jgi:hypothetical protein
MQGDYVKSQAVLVRSAVGKNVDEEKRCFGTNETLPWDFDLKRVLLLAYGDNPIKAFLTARRFRYAETADSEVDYRSKEAWRDLRGHVETLAVVDEVFMAIFTDEDLTHKDVMHSFWNTYKYALQLAYPSVFIGLNTYPGPHVRRAPFVGKMDVWFADNIKANAEAHGLELTYNCATWFDFLLENFDKFPLVNENKELQRFAQLTHTIGNITLVPKGFNRRRSCQDYWDFALLKLKAKMTKADWLQYVKNHEMQMYVTPEGDVIPFWENHFNVLTPTNEEELFEFVRKVNHGIEKRGKALIKRYQDTKNVRPDDFDSELE